MKLLKENIDLYSAYMLRDDGKLIKCDSVHPYIFYYSKDVIRGIYDLFTWMPQNLEWFYSNSKNNKLKELISIWIKSIDESLDYKISLTKEYLDYFDISESTKVIDNPTDIKNYFLYINNECNQEFCKVRTSGRTKSNAEGGSIYFRISSTHFNWFNLIWDLLYNNSRVLKDVTISTDENSGRDQFIYKHKGIAIDHLPIKEFLELSGNPIIEKYEVEDFIPRNTSHFIVDYFGDRLRLIKENFIKIKEGSNLYEELNNLFPQEKDPLQSLIEKYKKEINKL